MEKDSLGKLYSDGEAIIKQGETGNCMYIIQSGKAVVFQQKEEKEFRLAELKEGDFFGEMSIFTSESRSATVRAKGDAIVLTVDKENLLSKIQKEPTLAFRIIQQMSTRVSNLNSRYGQIRVADRRDWDSRPDETTGEKA